MSTITRRVLAASTVFVLAAVSGSATQAAHGAAERATLVSREPSTTFVGGGAARRATVTAAVDRYLVAGLSLPDLEVHFHDDRAECGEAQGRFRPIGDVGRIDLCYGGEFLALHELGHAWEHFNLDAAQRDHFQQITGATAWWSADVVWRRRGGEIAANTLAHGLLSTRLESADQRRLEFDRFESLTGIPSPRLAELRPAADVVPVTTSGDRARLAAYEAWRADLERSGPGGPDRTIVSSTAGQTVSRTATAR